MSIMDYIKQLQAKRKRNEAIRLAYGKKQSLASIARAFGISRQRVFQIINREKS